jgi:6-phosphogluconolactonase
MSATRIFDDLDALSRAAADDLRAIALTSIAERGTCHVALSGGSTPKRLFDVLAAMGRNALPWDRIDVWWGDERTVPPDHPDSNFGMARAHLIEPLGLLPARVHRMEGEADPGAAAKAYERHLVEALGAPPALDLIWLGMGPDGHTASLFPGSPGLQVGLERDALQGGPRYVIANPVDSPYAHGKTTRLTLTFPAINAARHVRFLVAGADKAERVREVVAGPPDRCPAQLVHPRDGELVWFLDAAAAARLGGRS